MPLGVSGIHHTSVIVTDFDNAHAFYSGVMGFEEIAKPSTFDFEVLWLRFGDCHVHLTPSDDPDSVSMRHVALHVDDINKARAHIRSHGCTVEETDPIPGADRFFTFDPDGNRIELIQWTEDYGTGK